MLKIMPLFTAAQLESICKAIADTSEGLTGREIEHFLEVAQIEDVELGGTKWVRLFSALVADQKSTACGNGVLTFISKAMAPARYQEKREVFYKRIERLNFALSFYGLEFRDDGRFHKIDKAAGFSDAERRANKFRSDLEARKVHPFILRFCKAELLDKNYFHAVLEACKGVAALVRKKTGLQSDGAALIDEAMGRFRTWCLDASRTRNRCNA